MHKKCRNIRDFFPLKLEFTQIIQLTSNNRGCNCRNRGECPLDNKGLTANIVYKAVVSAYSKPDKKYLGIEKTLFKDRFRNNT